MTRDTFADAVESLTRKVEEETVADIVAFLERKLMRLATRRRGLVPAQQARGERAALQSAIAGIKAGAWRKGER